MAGALDLSAGAPFPLPSGETPWLVEKGVVEVYLVSPERRRLVAVVPAGRHVFPVNGDGRLGLSLVATDGTRLTPAYGDDAGLAESAAAWLNGAALAASSSEAIDEDSGPPRLDRAEIVARMQSFIVALDKDHAGLDAERDSRDIARLVSRSTDGRPSRGAGAGALQEALATVAATLGVAVRRTRPGREADNFSAVAHHARLSGFRARRIVLPEGWWRLDLGALIARRIDDGRIEALCRHRRAYLDGEGRPIRGKQALAYDGVAYVCHAPFPDTLKGFGELAWRTLSGIGDDLVMIASAGLLGALVGLAVPLVTTWVFSDIVPTGEVGLLAAVGIALVAAALAQAVSHVAQAYAVARIEGRTAIKLAVGLTDRVLQLPARFFKTIAAGDLNQRIQGVEAMRAVTVDVLLSSGVTALFSLVYLALMFAQGARLALVAVVPSLIYIVALFISGFLQMAPLRRAAKIEGRLAGVTYEILEGIAKLRTAAAELRAMARWRVLYDRQQAVVARGARVANRFSAFADPWQIITLASLFAAAALLARGDVSTGAFIGFLTAFGIFQASLISFCEALLRILLVQPLAERARPILAAELEAASGRADPGALSGRIEANGVSFGYSEDGPPLIDGLEFALKPGEHMAIVGSSGSGKSTILRLLLGFERPRTGVVLYDGQDLAGLDPARVRGQIGVVLQSSSLFAGTILENIRGASDLSLEECLWAVELAGLADDLALLPMGVHTPITEGAGTLSGGQRQRILIARAIARKPRILFFDEATSALDNAVQAVVSNAIDAMRVSRVTIAHRLSTVRKADRICVVKNGRFAESGSFSELIARRGVFAELAERQLIGE